VVAEENSGDRNGTVFGKKEGVNISAVTSGCLYLKSMQK